MFPGHRWRPSSAAQRWCTFSLQSPVCPSSGRNLPASLASTTTSNCLRGEGETVAVEFDPLRGNRRMPVGLELAEVQYYHYGRARATYLLRFTRYAHFRSAPPPSAKVDVMMDEQLSAILPNFLNNVRRHPSGIGAALARGDFATIRVLGHNMKGTGTSFGLPQISEIGSELEQAAKQQDAETIRIITARLAHFLDSVEVHYK
jgi:histidine phosphotransfer protein HptB